LYKITIDIFQHFYLIEKQIANETK